MTETNRVIILTKQEKAELFKKAVRIMPLPSSSLWRLLWWNLFNKKKIDKFFAGLYLGKLSTDAFKDAK